MPREASDRNVTPTSKQQLHSGSGAIPHPNPAEDETDTHVVPLQEEATVDISPSGPSRRWTGVEDILRHRREEVLQSSIENAKRAERQPSSEREERPRRKAS